MGKEKKRKSSKSETNSAGPGESWIDPAEIRFTHARIRPVFSGCAKQVTETLAELVDGRLRLRDLPMITIVSGASDGVSPPYFSLNNRRLWVLKQLRDRSLLPDNKVLVKLKPPQDTRRLRDKYTPEKCSLTAKFMREKLPASQTPDSDGDKDKAVAAEAEAASSDEDEET